MESKNHCIFLVDDNIVALKTGKTLLQDYYTVVTMSSGDKLLLMLEKLKPDLVLLDIEMPGMNGYETIKKVKANPRNADIPIIFLSGKNEPENESMGLSLGAVDFIAKPFSPLLLLKRIEQHLLLNDINHMHDELILWTAELIEFRDEASGHHVERVQEYLKILIDEMIKTGLYAAELAEWDMDGFLKSVPLHDVGKIKIQDDILLKKACLTENEFTAMKLHALYGKMIIESLQNKMPNETFLECAKILSYCHHERWDGAGYPDHLKGREIPLQARMMALVDVYDALVSERRYKKAISHEQAMQIIAEGRGTQFDPDLVDLFINISGSIMEISKAEKND